jgi:signal transduction histidine kinase
VPVLPPRAAPEVAPASDLLDPFARIPLPVLRAAARRVAASWEREALEPRPGEEALEELVLVARAVGSESELARLAPESAPRAVLRRRLLDLLRTEAVNTWSLGDPPPSSAEILALLRSFERVREALDPAWDQQFSSLLAAPTGFDLVVEVAHDLRSPLTSILFLSETLRKGQSGEINGVQKRQLGIIYSAALGLISIASDIVEFARGGNRLVDSFASPFSVTEVLESVKDIVQPLAEEKGLTVRISPPAHDQRMGHPVALRRVLLNLTTNALKFTDEGMIDIVAEPREGSRVEFSVRDTGCGIDPAVQFSLYQPFRRSRAQKGYRFSGSGLGLVISRRLVEAMGSRLELETRPRWGARFFFELELPPVHPV